MKLIKLFLLGTFSCFFTLGIIAGCASSESKNSSETPSESSFSDSDYARLIEKNTDANIFYDGLQNSIDIKATFISEKVSLAQQQKMAEAYQWAPDKKSQELDKEKKLLETESRFFVSIYTPEKKYDDLDKNKTLWRVFVEVDGKQVEAKAKKFKLLEAEIKNLYPYYTSFTTAYIISVPVPTKTLRLHPFTLKITGPIAQTELNFNI